MTITVVPHPRRVDSAEFSSVGKAHNPLWDGDGVQGAGQPRDRRGRWIGLPGPTSIGQIGIFENSEGLFEVRAYDRDKDESGNRPQKLLKTYKSKAAANKFVAQKLREDADAYQKNKRSASARRGAAVRRQKKQDEQRAKANEERAQREKEIFGDPKKKKATVEVVPQNQPSRRRKVTPVQVSEMDRLENPGTPNQKQMAEAKKWAKENLPDNERKYSELIARLLQRRKITQDPKVRGEMSDRYGISAKRLIEIEQGTYEAMFPSNQPKQRRGKVGMGPATSQQLTSMQRLGFRRAFPESDPVSVNRPSRYFKIHKGPQRGKWGKVSWNGSVSIVDDKEAEQEDIKSKIIWTQRLKNNAELAEKMRLRRKAAQPDIEAMAEDAKRRKEAKIARAKSWAEENGLDPEDSYWWAMFWNDNSLLKSQTDETSTPMTFALAEAVIRQKMDPADLEGLLALPDISSRDIRGHRPGPKRQMRDDEDFTPASPEQREDSDEWKARQRDIQIRHDRRALMREYKQYLKSHPRSKASFEYWKKRIKKIQKAAKVKCGVCGEYYFTDNMDVPEHERCSTMVDKSLNIAWDGDGVQGIGQPRDRRGRWSENGAMAAASTVAGLVERGARQHHGSSPRRSASSVKRHGAKNISAFDDKNKVVTGRIKKPQKGSTHQQMAAGKPVKKTNKKYTPEQAYYARNTGATGITDARLREIYEDRSKIKPTEHDLITAAAGDVNYDGSKEITYRSVKAGGERRKMQRWMMIKNLRTQLAQDYAKQNKLGSKGEGGQRRINVGERARQQNQKDNEKRAKNERNRADTPAARRELLLDFGDGEKARCIFCGGYVYFEDVSPERIKPGALDGIYDRGNKAPAHIKCNKNTNSGISAQFKPEQYHEMMLKQFLKNYKEWIDAGYLGFVFDKHKGKLKEMGVSRPKVRRKS